MSSNAGEQTVRRDVEDVSVDTRHWIGGERVASAETFTDVSPIDEQPIAEVHAGGQQEVDAAVAAAQAAFPAWAALPAAERADAPARGRRRHRQAGRGPGPGRDPRQRLAAALAPARRHAPGRR